MLWGGAKMVVALRVIPFCLVSPSLGTGSPILVGWLWCVCGSPARHSLNNSAISSYQNIWVDFNPNSYMIFNITTLWHKPLTSVNSSRLLERLYFFCVYYVNALPPLLALTNPPNWTVMVFRTPRMCVPIALFFKVFKFFIH